MAWTAKQPRARVPVCGVCDRQLYAGGRSWAEMRDDGGILRQAHKSCVAAVTACVECGTYTESKCSCGTARCEYDICHDRHGARCGAEKRN